MEFDDEGLTFYCTTTIQLLRLFPHPSRHHWFPSWAQVQQYPDVSVREDDHVLIKFGNFRHNMKLPRMSRAQADVEDMDYSLRIMSGRIYRGCSLKLKEPPTPEWNATYHCSMGSKLVKLVATVPGIELNIDSGSKYVLVDITPDHSLWPSRVMENCRQDRVGHVHPPTWRESVIIVCKEVDRLAHAQPVQVTTGSPAILRYHLRRITTLLYNPMEFNSWLSTKPSLEHMRSVVCSAEVSMGQPHSVTSLCLLDVFCDPAAVEGLPIKDGKREWDKCPLYEVYLV